MDRMVHKPPFRTFHQTRLKHTFFTRMILGGMDIKTVQILMGHAHAETTMRIYANVTRTQAQDEMIRIEGEMKLK